MMIKPYDFRNRSSVIESHRYATLSPNKVRLDSIETVYENGTLFLNRSTHFGDMYRYFFDIRDFIFSKTNLETGEIKSVESSVSNNFEFNRVNNCIPDNYIDIDGKVNASFINRTVYRSDKLVDFKYQNRKMLSDNIAMPLIANAFEDEFNMEFTRTVGVLASVMTAVSLSLPFRADIIIDNVDGFNITKKEFLMLNKETRKLYEKIFKNFAQSIEMISKRLKNEYIELKEGGNLPDHIRILASLREFDSYIKIINYDNMNRSFNIALNNSDHIRILMTSMSHLGSDYTYTESFGDLIDAKCELTAASMFETEMARENFEICREAENYTVSYGN